MYGEEIRVGDIRTGKTFKGVPKLFSGDSSLSQLAPNELLKEFKYFGNIVLNPQSILKQKEYEKLIPAGIDNLLQVLYSQKTKKIFALCMKTNGNVKPLQYRDQLWKQLDYYYNLPGRRELPTNLGMYRGLEEFCNKAIVVGEVEQVYLNGEHLVILYTKPYKMLDKVVRKNHTSSVCIIYLDLSEYRRANED